MVGARTVLPRERSSSLPALQGYSLVLAWLWCHLAFRGIDLNWRTQWPQGWHFGGLSQGS